MGKKVIYVLIVIQALLICSGIYDLIEGDYLMGSFLIILNAVFMAINFNTLKDIRDYDL